MVSFLKLLGVYPHGLSYENTSRLPRFTETAAAVDSRVINQSPKKGDIFDQYKQNVLQYHII
jgi:hypothetical protein